MNLWTLQDKTVNLYADQELECYLGRTVESKGKWQVEDRDKILSVHKNRDEALRVMKKHFKCNKQEKEALEALREWKQGYQPCKGTESDLLMQSLEAKGYAALHDGKYYCQKMFLQLQACHLPPFESP